MQTANKYDLHGLIDCLHVMAFRWPNRLSKGDFFQKRQFSSSEKSFFESPFFPLKCTAEKSQRPKMQFTQIHTQRRGMYHVLNFQWPDRWNSISMVLEKKSSQIDRISSVWFLRSMKFHWSGTWKNQPLVPEKLVIIQFHWPCQIKPGDEHINNYI